MRLNEYQAQALRTEDMTRTQRDRIIHGAMGLAGEAGETVDLLKKVVAFGHDIDTAKIRGELGDVLWYVAVLADAVGLTLNEVAQANVYKLRQRYPIGEGFTAEASKARVDVADDSAGHCVSCDGATARRVDGDWKCSRCSADLRGLAQRESTPGPCPTVFVGTGRLVQHCTRAWLHGGPHRDDEGNEWGNEGREIASEAVAAAEAK